MEVEIKLRPADWHIAERIMEDWRVTAYQMAPFTQTEMESVYYDTVEGHLQDRRWALRVRREGEKTVAACKAAEEKKDGLFARREWEVQAQTLQEALPLLVEAGAPAELPDFGEMVPQCRVIFTRTAAPLRLPDDTVVEAAFDHGRLVADEKEEAFCELELELLAGQVEEMQDLAEYLTKKYTLAVEHAGKYARALRLIRSRNITPPAKPLTGGVV